MNFKHVKDIRKDIKPRYRLIDDYTSRMAKETKGEDFRYNYVSDKDHKASAFFRPVHHIEKKGYMDLKGKGALSKRMKKSKGELTTSQSTVQYPIFQE